MRAVRVFIGLMCGLGLAASLLAQTALPGQDRQRLADGLYSRGLYELALEEYRRLLEEVPNIGNREMLLFRTAESTRQLGKTREAEELFLQVVELAGKKDVGQRARYRLAELAFARDDLASAGRFLRELVRSAPDPGLEAPARFLLGQVLEAQGEVAMALSQYRLLMDKAPEGELAGIAALRIAGLGEGSVEERREAFELALRRAASDDMRVEALWGLAGLEAAASRPDNAAKRYWELWTGFPDHSRVRNGLLTIAWSQLQAGEFARALSLYEKTTAENRESVADAWAYLRAVSLQRLDRSEEALSAYISLLDSFPGSRFRSVAGYEAASLSAAAGNHERVKEYEEEIRQVPGRKEEGLWMLAESARAAGNEARALRLYRELVEEVPEAKRVVDARYLMALMLRKEEPLQSAADLEEFAGDYPEDARAIPALQTAGDLYLAEDRPEKAFTAWSTAVSGSASPDAGLLRRTALLAVRLEKDEEAIRLLNAWQSLDLPKAEKADAKYWLGVVLERSGEAPAAAEALREALSLAPDADWTGRARMRLGRLFQQEGKEGEALRAFLPLVGESERPLPDGLLIWLLEVAKGESDTRAQLRIATAMQQAERPNNLREKGAYEEAAARRELEDLPGAIKAWRRGLAFDSGTLEAVEAGLALGNALLDLKQWEEALEVFSAAAATASALERGRVQAQALTGMGKAEEGRDNWEAAARHFLSVSVLFDDPELVPFCLKAAAENFERAGQSRRAAAARRELNERYPEAGHPDPNSASDEETL
jgi:tetratricopeptide (TPR) repeat protein